LWFNDVTSILIWFNDVTRILIWWHHKNCFYFF
jgi:hypothetical protein